MNRTTIVVPRSLSAGPARDHRGRAARPFFDVSSEWLAGGAALALASNALIGFLGMALFIGCSGLILLRDPLYNLRQLLRFAPLMLLPALAILSTAWSDAPPRTMRAALELFVTFSAAVIIARNLRRERMVLALFLGFLMLAVSTLPYVTFALATKSPLVGQLGSKNQVGFVGYALFACAVVMVFDRRHPALLRFTALAGVPLGLLIAYLAQSGGTTTECILFLLVFPPLAVLGAMAPVWRVGVTAISALMASVGAFFINDLIAQVAMFRTTVLNKDATLTGRTYLWDFAARLSERRPYLGYGYSSFWRRGNIDAEGLWRWAGIAPGGFNFHNLIVGMQIDLGLVGVTILLATCVVVLLVALARQIIQPSVAMAGLIGLMVVLYARSYVEEGLVAPFSLPTLIWLTAVVYAVAADTAAVTVGTPIAGRLPKVRARRQD